jgi:hypothetical protein
MSYAEVATNQLLYLSYSGRTGIGKYLAFFNPSTDRVFIGPYARSQFAKFEPHLLMHHFYAPNQSAESAFCNSESGGSVAGEIRKVAGDEPAAVSKYGVTNGAGTRF